jgi:hypothetical protein
MTLARLLTVALAVSSTVAFAQKNTDSVAVSDRPADRSKTAVTSSEPWKFIPSRPVDGAAERDPLNRLQIDNYKVFRATETRNLLVGPDADAGMFLTGLEGMDTDTTCYKIRSYVVARDSKDSDSTHPVSYSTCQPAKRYGLKTTDIPSGPVNR